ncbi:MAG: hypothetical protein ACM3X6_03855 [Patescibacteria group bacterium]
MVVAEALQLEPFVAAGPRRVKRAAVKPAYGLKAYFLLFGFCLILFGANAVLYGLVTTGAAHNETLARALAETVNQGRQIELDMAYLASYPRIAAEAETQLAMFAPGPGEVRFIALAAPAEPVRLQSPEPAVSGTGLTAAVGDWLRAFGRTAASTW